jgi:hypothetical protein
MTPDAIKKNVMALLKVWKVIQQNMMVSGEHGSDPYNFVEVAMKKVGKSGLSYCCGVIIFLNYAIIT